MKKNIIFYFINQNKNQQGLSAIEQLVCEITAKYWRNGKSILIACDDKKQAIRLDNVLWIRPLESFIPHNLSGEGPKCGAPIEIIWPQKHNNSTRDVLINLCIKFADFTNSFTEIVDFIPYEESLKQSARERYRAYRSAGFNLKITTWK